MSATDSLDMLLIGRAGNGKSSTGNNILGKDSFLSTADTQSKTKSVSYDKCKFEGNILKVVDCPGLGDTRLGIDLDAQQLSDAIRKAIEDHPDGFHAIVYITKFGNRFDRFDAQALEIIEHLVGHTFIREHCIILMTGGDNFMTDPAIKKTYQSFEDWVDKQTNKYFKKIIEDCKKRILLFDNRTDDPEKIQAQKRKLVEMIKQKGQRYTNKDFEKARKKREKLTEKLRYKQELIDCIDKIGILTSQLKNVTNDVHGAETLNVINNEARILRSKAEEKSNSALHLFMLFFEAMEAKQEHVCSNIEREAVTRKTFEKLERQYLQVKIYNF